MVLRGFCDFLGFLQKLFVWAFFERVGEAKSYKQSHPTVLITKCPICNLLGKKVLMLYNNFMVSLIIEIGSLEDSSRILKVLRFF